MSEKSPLNLARISALLVGYILKMNLKALREAVSLALYIFADFIKNKGAAS